MSLPSFNRAPSATLRFTPSSPRYIWLWPLCSSSLSLLSGIWPLHADDPRIQSDRRLLLAVGGPMDVGINGHCFLGWRLGGNDRCRYARLTFRTVKVGKHIICQCSPGHPPTCLVIRIFLWASYLSRRSDLTMDSGYRRLCDIRGCLPR